MTLSNLDRRLLLQAAALSPALAVVTAAKAADSPDKMVVIAELVAKPERANDLRNILVPFVEGARKEPGCEHYTLLEDRQTPGRFLTYEIWTDEAAITAHMRTPQIKAAGEQLAGILTKPFTQIMLKTLSTS